LWASHATTAAAKKTAGLPSNIVGRRFVGTGERREERGEHDTNTKEERVSHTEGEKR